MDLQKTQTEDNRHTQPLLPRHPQAPDNVLREQENSNITDKLERGRENLELAEIETFLVRYGQVPDGLVRDALEAQGDDDRDASGNLEEDDDHTAPVERTPIPVALGDEHATPFHQDGTFQEG